MKLLPELIVTCTLAALAFEFVPLYGSMVAGLFDQVSNGLALAASV